MTTCEVDRLNEISQRPSQVDVKDTIVRIGRQTSKRWGVGYVFGPNPTLSTS